MVIANMVLGILMIFSAVSILTVPTLSGILICYVLSGTMLVYGVISIVRFIEAKNSEKVAKKEGKPFLKTDIGSLIFGIAAIVLSIIATTSDAGAALFIEIVTVVFGAWIVFDGVSSIRRALVLKKAGFPGWIVSIIMGALIILSGIFCIVNVFAGLTAVSTMYGISLMMFGFALMI